MTSDPRTPRDSHSVVIASDDLRAQVAPDFVVEPYSEQSELVEKWHLIRRYLPHLVIAALLGVGFVWMRQTKQIPRYIATSTVRFRDTRASLTSGFANAAEFYNQTDIAATQAELLNTRATRERAVDSANLQVMAIQPGSIDWLSNIDAKGVTKPDTLSIVFDGPGIAATFHNKSIAEAYGALVRLPELSFVVPQRQAVGSAKYVIVPRETAIGSVAGVSVSRRGETDVADLSLIGPDPVFVQRALNAMTLALETTSQSSDQRSARDRRRFLDNQIRRTDSILEDQRGKLSAFRAQTQTFDAAQKGSQEQVALSNLKARREELAADRQVYTSLLQTAVSARARGDLSKLKSLVGATGVNGNTIISDLYSQLQKLSLSRDSLTKGPFASASTNPDLQHLSSQIESVTDELISAVRSSMGTYDARIAALDALASRTTQEVSSLPATQAEEEKLRDDVQSTQRMSDQLHDEQQRAQISEVAQGGKVEIIDLAGPAGPALQRGPFNKLFLGGLVGVIIALGLIFLYEELNTSLRRKADVERLLDLPTLGSIPALSRGVLGNGQKLLGRKSGPKKTSGKALVPITSSPVFESYRAIRTNLIFSHAVQSLRSVALTSASPGEGKSTTVANLAIAFAQQNLKVLIVDCDLRRGSLHRIFNLPRVPGLTNAVVGGADINEVIRETSTPNLSIITTGIQPPNPGELLGSDSVRRLLLEAQNQFDIVLIDTPPLLAAADAGVIASMVDGVILLIRVGVTTKSAARSAQERLRLVGARILGTVLNDPKEMLDANEEYYHYDYVSSGFMAGRS